MDCHLIISYPGEPQLSHLENLELPALNKLLACAQHEMRQIESVETWLCSQFGVPRQEDWPIAALTLLGEGKAPEEHYWLRADPVYVQLKGNVLVLMGNDCLKLSLDETMSYIENLNRHFQGQGFSFHATHPQHWYIKLDQPQHIQTFPLLQATGRDIHHHLPGGQDALKWHGILNEVQMLLCATPMNEEREQAGKYPVNSIWLWGGGILPKRLPELYDHIWSNDELTRGLALASGVTWSPLPASWAQRQAGEAGNSRLGVILDASNLPPHHDGAVKGWDTWMNLERNWLSPIKHCLEKKTLREATIYMVNDSLCHEFHVKANDLWKFWRRNKAFKAQ